MTLEEFDRRIAQINGLLVSAGSKLNQAAELHVALDKKLDRLEDKIGRRGKIDRVVDLSASTDRKIELFAKTEQKSDRVADKIDKLADVSASTNRKLDRLVEALLRRERQRPMDYRLGRLPLRGQFVVLP